MTTLHQDAERLREMAEETCNMAARVRTHIRSQDRIDTAFNVEGAIGGLWGRLRSTATMLDELINELEAK